MGECMKIIESNIVQKKLKKKKISTDMKNQIIRKIQRLSNRESEQKAIDSYLKSQNSKKLYEHIYKFRINNADRMVYTFGKYLKDIKEEDHDSIFLLDFISHDEQKRYNNKTPTAGDYEHSNDSSDIDQMELLEEEDVLQLGIEDLNPDLYLERFRSNHSMYIYNDDLANQIKESDQDVYLSCEQEEIIEDYITKQTPTLVMGGAGTGKTIVALHILHDYIGLESNSLCCAYFTQSEELMNTAKKKFQILSKNENIDRVDFININEYCIQNLGLNQSKLVKYEQFKGKFMANLQKHNPHKNTQLKKLNISTYDLWAEIRGTIKGSLEGLDKKWSRSEDWFDQKNFNAAIMKEFEQNKIIDRNPSNPKKFQLKQEVIFNNTGQIMLLSSEAKSAYKQILETIKRVNPNLPIIGRRSYLAISEENTTLEKEKREFLYDFCKNEYQSWLKSEKYYDENDLVRKMLLKFNISALQTYDLIVVDEIQDYTEYQIYFLKQLVKSTKGMIMAGDTHQIINPTMFRERRLYTLFNAQLKSLFLTKNFRCQKKIVEYANTLADLRSKYIAKTKIEIKECAIYDGKIPVKLTYSDKNIQLLIEKLLEIPSAVILVADEFVKKRLIELYGAKQYQTKQNQVIFTVAEIKGMEYKSVFCFNLISSHYESWSKMFQERTAKKKTKYRYYFNLLYVALTRAQRYLCFIEEKNNKTFEEAIQKHLTYVPNVVQYFDQKALYLDELGSTNEDWRIQAQKYIEQGKYEEAISSLQKADAPEEEILECKMHLYIQKGIFYEVMKYALYLNKKEIAEKYYKELVENKLLFTLIEWWLNPSSLLSIKKLEKTVIIRNIDACFPQLEEQWRNKIILRYIKLLSKQIIGFTAQLEEGLENKSI